MMKNYKYCLTVQKKSNDSIIRTVLRPFSKCLKIIRPGLKIQSLEYVEFSNDLLYLDIKPRMISIPILNSDR